MNKIIENIRKDLILKSDERTKQSGERFFKEDVVMYGIKSSDTKKIGRDHYNAINDKSKSHIFSLCDELWKSGYMEESFVACNWSYNIRKYFEPKDFEIFNRWVNSYVNNWASCDTFCNHTVGAFIEMYPDYLSELKKWCKSSNRWVRRAASVSLIIPAKKGMFLDSILEIADRLHLDQDDMVQKGYGWLLKVASQAHETIIFEYVMSKKGTMPRTALRYAIEKMPRELKILAMAK